MSTVKRCNFIHDSVDYYCDLFQFLSVSVPDKTTATNTPIRITCFDVSQDFLLFGSNIGIVYGFRRRTRITNEPHFTFSLNIRSGIQQVVILSPDLVLLSTACTLLLYNLSQRSPVWESSEQTESSITALKSLHHQETNSFHLLVGDSAGRVVKHVIQSCHPFVSHMHEVHDEATQLRQEEENQQPQTTSTKHKHEVVQIDVIDDGVYLISTCFRSIIVTDSSSNSSEGECRMQVGKNQRKVCGKYGAVFSPDEKVIYASRPSGHLIRASVESGQALQTYIMKRAEKPPVRKVFADVRQESITTSNTSSPLMQMGRLMQVTPDLLLSFTTRSISLLTTHASLVIQEGSLIPVMDVSCLRANESEFEIFILFQDRSLIRIRNVDLPVLTSSSSSSDGDHDPTSLIDGMINKLIPHALSFPVMSSILATFELATSGEIRMRTGAADRLIEEPVKKEQNTEKEGDEVKLFTLQDSNSQEEGEDQPPLVTHKKVRRKSNDMTRKRVPRRESRLTLSKGNRLRSNASSMGSLTDRVSIFSDNNSSNNDTQSSDGKESESPKAIEPLDDNQQLLQILNAYREKVGIPKIESEEDDSVIPNDTTSVHNDTTIGNDGDSNRMDTSMETVVANPVSQTLTDNDSLPTIDTTTTVAKEYSHDIDLRTEISSKELMKEKQPLPVPVLKPVTDSKDTSSVLSMKWDLRLPSKMDLHFDPASIVCIAAFSDDMRDGLAMLSACDETGSACIHIFPGWRKIKCPRHVSKVKAMHVNCKQILLLHQDGSLFRCTNWSRSRFFSFGPTFHKVHLCRTRSLTSMSVNTMDNVCWSCDQEGTGWMLRLATTPTASCVPVRDDSQLQIRLKNIVVSVRNSAIVWATDDNQRLYCRAGIFNEKSDKDSLIAGINWVPVDDLPAGQLLLLTASSDSIWILCRSAGKERLFRRCGICTPIDYVGSHWQEYELPVHAGVLCITASSTDDMWIMTEKQAVYQHCPHDGCAMKSVENGWLLV